MCGIAGFIALADAPSALDAILARMLAPLVHRGPNAEGRWLQADRGFGFGMRRLSVVDLAGGNQPIWNEDATIGVVFNGEIYNHGALRAELAARGHVFRTRSDTEVLVHLYEEAGTGMFTRLQGMYAFALVDLRNASVLLARDPFGQKPLYFFAPTPGSLAFASEPKALRHAPGWRGEIDAAAYLPFVTWLSLPAPHTHWRGVEKFAPGEWRRLDLRDATVRDRGVTSAVTFSARPDLKSPETAAAELEVALRDSVRRHLEADVSVGLLLSGGSDSLALGWVTAQTTMQRLHTFTAGFHGLGNEFAPARRTSRLLNSIHHEIELDPDCLVQEVDTVLHHLDEPIGDPAAVAVLAVCRAAREHVTVLLGGEGSDELFAGYAGRYAGLAATLGRTRRLHRWFGWLPRASMRSFAKSRLGRAWERGHTSPLDDLLMARAEGLHPHHPWIREQHLELGAAWRKILPTFTARLNGDLPADLDVAQSLDLAWQLPESLLVKADRMSMAASIELRCPYLDPVVAGVAGRIAPEARLGNGSEQGKRALHALLRRHLPNDASRPKEGFPLPLGRWLRGPLAADMRDRLTDGDSQFARLVGRRAAVAWCDEFMAGKQSAHITYTLWLYERWRQTEDAAALSVAHAKHG